jgi:hypothetical protein
MHTLDLMYFGDQSVEPFESILQLVSTFIIRSFETEPGATPSR